MMENTCPMTANLLTIVLRWTTISTGDGIMDNLIKVMEQIQSDRDLTQTAFMESLGFDKSYWSKLKNGERNPGVPFLMSLYEKYPESRYAILNYIAQGDIKVDDIPTAYHLTHQNGFLAHLERFLIAILRHFQKIGL